MIKIIHFNYQCFKCCGWSVYTYWWRIKGKTVSYRDPPLAPGTASMLLFRPSQSLKLYWRDEWHSSKRHYLIWCWTALILATVKVVAQHIIHIFNKPLSTHRALCRSMCSNYFSPHIYSSFSFNITYLFLWVCVRALTQTHTESKVKIQRPTFCTRQSNKICSFTLLYCVSILLSSALRYSWGYLTQQSAKPAIAFEPCQRFWCSYRPGFLRLTLSEAKGCLTSSASVAPQAIYYSRPHLISGQQEDSLARSSSISTSADISQIPIMIKHKDDQSL